MLTLENSPGLGEILMGEQNVTSEQLVQWAQDSLEVGHDSPSLLRLAIEEPPYFTPDLLRLFDKAKSELGIEQVTSEQARVFFAQVLARRLQSEGASALQVASRLMQVFPLHDARPPFDVWWQLEEAFTCDYCRNGVELKGKALEDAIFEELQNLLGLNWRAA